MSSQSQTVAWGMIKRIMPLFHKAAAYSAKGVSGVAATVPLIVRCSPRPSSLSRQIIVKRSLCHGLWEAGLHKAYHVQKTRAGSQIKADYLLLLRSLKDLNLGPPD